MTAGARVVGGPWRLEITKIRCVKAGRRCRRLTAAALIYSERKADPADPSQRVSFGTSGPRGYSWRGTFTEAHIHTLLPEARRPVENALRHLISEMHVQT